MTKIVACNQKMYLTKDEAEDLKLQYDNIDASGVDFIVAPSYLNFDVFKDYILSSQNCFYEDKGSFTGEISAYDLHLRNIKYSIIGHSERRQYETLETINLKVKACYKNSITPIICIGETKLEKEMMKTSSVLKKQITTALEGVEISEGYEVIIAYEPIHKINSKTALTKSEIEDTLDYIRKVLLELNIENYRLLYGGSVNGKNIKDIISDKIDGYLIGRACVDGEGLSDIIKCIKSVK